MLSFLLGIIIGIIIGILLSIIAFFAGKKSERLINKDFFVTPINNSAILPNRPAQIIKMNNPIGEALHNG